LSTYLCDLANLKLRRGSYKRLKS